MAVHDTTYRSVATAIEESPQTICNAMHYREGPRSVAVLEKTWRHLHQLEVKRGRKEPQISVIIHASS